MNWESLLSGAVGAGVLAIILKLIELYFSRPKIKAETTVLKSEATENINEAAQVAVNILQSALTYKATENAEYQKQVKEQGEQLKKMDLQIQELQDHRDERTKQLEDLTENNEALTAQVSALRMQIAKDTSETRELVAKYQELKEFTRSLLDFLEKRGVDLSELSGKIPESILKWKPPK